MLTVASTLQFLRIFAAETHTVSLADWLRLKLPLSSEDKNLAKGIAVGVIKKLKSFSRAAISTRPNVRCHMLTTYFYLSTTGGLLPPFFLLIS